MAKPHASLSVAAALVCLAGSLALHRADEGDKKPPAVPLWIWLGAKPTDDQTVYVRAEFTLKQPLKSAKLQGTCDNQMTVYINGKEVASSDAWEVPVSRNVTKHIKTPGKGEEPARNVIAVKAHNREGPAGLLLRLILESSDKQTTVIVTDASWRVSERAAKGWKDTGFDDSAWSKATVIGKLGDGPWAYITEAALGGAAKFAKPTATPVELIKAKKDFKVELLYSVPKQTHGSWVSMCVDPKGRLITSDQYGKLYRVTPPAIGGKAEDTRVEELPVELGEAQGLLWAFDSLYVVVNHGRKYDSGLWRVRASKNDDVLDAKEKLRAINGNGEHGPHAVLLAPDGKSLYVVCGNHTAPMKLASSKAPQVWGEDFIVPRLWDANHHAEGIKAPAGCIYKTDPDGKHWELISMGYRNPYDMALNRDGELFTYDADMEWDMSLPWYRPTRLCHAIPGSEFGWRGGTGKMYEYHPDNLPPVVDIGPGSPTGMTFGYGAKFPAKYQDALFMCDWSYGKLYAVHLQPHGCSYTGEVEEFLNGSPLPLTDIVVNPRDGAMYFIIGGRVTMSGLYRVSYVGKESTRPVKEPEDGAWQTEHRIRIILDADKLAMLKLTAAHVVEAIREQNPAPAGKLSGSGSEYVVGKLGTRKSIDKFGEIIVKTTPRGMVVRLRDVARLEHEVRDCAAMRASRRQLESFYGKKDAKAVEAAWPHLRSDDRFLRFAARTVLEFQDPKTWQERALKETDAIALTHALIGLARVGDKALEPKMLEALERVEWSKLTPPQKIDYLRAYQLTFIRMGAASDKWKQRVGKRLDAVYPAEVREVNAELCKLICYLEAPGGVAKTLALMAKAPTQEEQIEYALSLRTVKSGWTRKQHEEYFNWFHKGATYRGGNSFHGFLKNIRNDAIKSLSDEERTELKTVLANVPQPSSPKFKVKDRPFVKKWTVDELVPIVEKGLKQRDFDRGRNLFGEAKCFSCHRFNNEGGGLGPDLTGLSGRFGARDLLESIIEPSKVVSDQYQAIVVTLTDGRTVTGRIVNLAGDSIQVNTDMLDPNKLIGVNRNQIEKIAPSKVSMMPEGLIDTLDRDEILDLAAYLYSRGDRTHKMFRREKQ